jgi:bacterioferritin (cytochrome b1)
MAASEIEREGFKLCTEVGDTGSAEIFADLLKGSMDSIANIEALKYVIATVSLANFLANQTELPPSQTTEAG